MNEQEAISDEEAFHNSYRVFAMSVKLLAALAVEQCELMGNHNVAWELKDDVSAGAYLVGRGYLSPNQEAWVSALVGALAVANTQVLPSGASGEANLVAMQNPCWEPLRFVASETLRQLEPFTVAKLSI
jgi:hypothetical protein